MAVNPLAPNSTPVATTRTTTAAEPAAAPAAQTGLSAVSTFDQSPPVDLNAKSGKGQGTVTGIPDTSGFDYDPARVALYQEAQKVIQSDTFQIDDKGRTDKISRVLSGATADKFRTEAYNQINAALSDPNLSADEVKDKVAKAIQSFQGQVFGEKVLMDMWWGSFTRIMNEKMGKLKEVLQSF